MNNNFSLLKIINGLSRTLNIANQMIPLYKQIKPILTNSNKVFENIKNFTNSISASENKSNNNYYNQNTNTNKINNLNTPTFFQ